MSDHTPFGFGKFVPGFDFLQGLAQGASSSMPQMPNLANWVAPTLSVEELDKRIGELKAVHFWLDQNGKALAATIQALEVQKMTLATLKGMNFSMGDVADALKLRPEAASGSAAPATEDAKKTESASSGKSSAKTDGPAAAAMVDPLQWWGALTQQFQEIATKAMSDAAQKTPMEAAQDMAKETMKAADGAAQAASAPAPARKAAAKAKPKRSTATRKRAAD